MMGVVLRSLARSPTSSSRPTSCLPPRLVSLRHTCRAVSREAVEAAGDKGKGGGKCVVVVESPAKAKSIQKYLGENYDVYASYGHVRDLVPKAGSVIPIGGEGGGTGGGHMRFEMIWGVHEKYPKRLAELVEAAMGAREIILATDPDREGEAISWHVHEILKERGLVEASVPIRRVTFTEVTEASIKNAFKNNVRDVADSLVDAYRARKALDYLVGYSVSPLLWRRLPGAKSAGRVMCATLQILCEQEESIERFIAEEFWKIHATVRCDEVEFQATLQEIDGEKVHESIATEKMAKVASERIRLSKLKVSDIKERKSKRQAPRPLTTSDLQQLASTRYGMRPEATMFAAQKLYEGNLGIAGNEGLITYHRTDGAFVAPNALDTIRRTAVKIYGEDFVLAEPKIYKSKQKNAQEAHEAIRPTNATLLPSEVVEKLGEKNKDVAMLYGLIWERTIASQMESAEYLSTSVIITGVDTEGKELTLKAGSSLCTFEGWRASKFTTSAMSEEENTGKNDSEENRDDGSGGPDSTSFSNVRVGSEPECLGTSTDQHFTRPPPNYSDASLIKSMEDCGIGRPSTYAPTIKKLIDKGYVQRGDGGGSNRRKLVPTLTGRLLNTYLSLYMAGYFHQEFTAKMEEKLDEVSAGKVDWSSMLEEFWVPFSGSIEAAASQEMKDVVRKLDETFGNMMLETVATKVKASLAKARLQSDDGGEGSHLDNETIDSLLEVEKIRECPKCGTGRLTLQTSKNGAFLSCSNYTSEENRCDALINLNVANLVQFETELIDERLKNGWPIPLERLNNLSLSFGKFSGAEPTVIGSHPDTNTPVLYKVGPYGPYAEYECKKEKKKYRASLPKTFDPDALSLDWVLGVLSLKHSNFELGRHPETSLPVTLHSGKFGLYIKHDGVSATLKVNHLGEPVKSLDSSSYDTVTLDMAVDALSSVKSKKKKS